MAKLINGNGNPAIYAAEDADLIASLAGNVTCIANVGNKYAATEEDATTIRLDDGVIITKEGRRIQLEVGESDTFYIPTGTIGQTNYYIIGYKLVQNADSTQVAEQFVQKMNSSSETITEDTFRSGATEVYVSVYRVTQVGFTIDSVSGLLPELLDSAAAKDNIAQINSDLYKGRVSVTGQNGETIGQLLNRLTQLIDFSKINFTSHLVTFYGITLAPTLIGANSASFSSCVYNGIQLQFDAISIASDSSKWVRAVSSDMSSIANYSNDSAANGTFTLYY